MSRTTCRYGCWPSPIKAEHVAAAGRKFADLCVDPAAPDTLYWSESRPEEAGRCTIMRQRRGEACASLLEVPYGARSAVHEYGGGTFTAYAGAVWFVNGDDQAIYRHGPDGALSRITAADDPARYADLQYDATRGCLIAVAETPIVNAEPRATVVRIAADGTSTVIAEGHDFYASPRLSPAGDRLVWLAWDHPAMSWDSTELWQAEIVADGRIDVPRCVRAQAGESLFGPFFDPHGRLHVVCDADNWWNIYCETESGALQQLTHETAEFGVPQWVFGQKTCAFDVQGRLFALSTADGLWRLGAVATDTGAYAPISVDATHMEQLVATGDGLALLAADAATAPRIVRLGHPEVGKGAEIETVRATAGLPVDAVLSRPQPMAYATAGADTAHALFYPPAQGMVKAPADELPPLLIKCHGGPTGATSTALDARIQYWTSRGYAVLDVNYRGSTGYGRAYRNKLIGAWGVADVEDCVHGARQLAADGRIDAQRVLISGSSAGGYTVLCVLTFSDLAAAGASYYGIGDLRSLLATTHKFESRYVERLIGPDDAVLDARSPLQHIERLACPVLFLQGLKDKVVPPDQAASMAAALRERGLPVAYVTFADERHGFRAAANIRHAIEAERRFYERVLHLDNKEPGIELAIDNLD